MSPANLDPLGVDARSAAQAGSPVATAQTSLSGPNPLWLALGFILAGIGTVMLGPLLPWLSRSWLLSDAQSGDLLAVKFIGSFLGGFTVLPRLRVGIFTGAALACLGFGFFALAGGFLLGCLGLFVGGYGLGQLIASTNILVGRRNEPHAGSALALLNLFWSLGAVVAGLLAAVLLPRFGMREPMLAFAALFLLTGVGGAYASHATTGEGGGTLPQGGVEPHRLPLRTLLHFGGLLFLYGGLETSISGWLTTYTIRFSTASWMGGQSALVLLWTAITAGRGLTSLAMRIWTEERVRAAGLLLALVALGGLFLGSHPLLYLGSCVLLGLSLAPFFPASFARLMWHHPTARTSGRILAVSGLGAALFPWLMGLLSAHTGSLQVALGIPILLTVGLILLSFSEPPVLPIQNGSGTVQDRFSAIR